MDTFKPSVKPLDSLPQSQIDNSFKPSVKGIDAPVISNQQKPQPQQQTSGGGIFSNLANAFGSVAKKSLGLVVNPVGAISSMAKDVKSSFDSTKGAFDALTSSEHRFGQTLGDAAATQTPEFAGAQKSISNLSEVNAKLSKSIQSAKARGEDVSHLQNIYNQNQDYINKNIGMQDVTPSISKSTEQIAGEGLGVATDIASMGEYGSASKLANTGEVVKNIVKPGASLVSRAGEGALKTGIFSASQGASSGMQDNLSASDVVSQAEKAGTVGAITGAAIPVLSDIGKAVSKKLSTGVLTRTLNPASGDFTFGKNPIDAMKEVGPVNSIQDLNNKAWTSLDALGKEKGKILSSPEVAAKKLDVSGVIDKIDEEIKNAAESGQEDLFNRLKKFRDTVSQTWGTAADPTGAVQMVSTGQRDLANLTPEAVDELKQIVGKQRTWTMQSSDKEVNRIVGGIYSDLAKTLHGAVPEVANIDSKWSDMLQLGKSAQKAAIQAEAKRMRFDIIDAGAGIEAGNLALNGKYKEALGVVGADVVRKILGSPAIATRFSSTLDRMSNADIDKLAQTNPTVAAFFNGLITSISSKASSAVSR